MELILFNLEVSHVHKYKQNSYENRTSMMFQGLLTYKLSILADTRDNCLKTTVNYPY